MPLHVLSMVGNIKAIAYYSLKAVNRRHAQSHFSVETLQGAQFDFCFFTLLYRWKVKSFSQKLKEIRITNATTMLQRYI